MSYNHLTIINITPLVTCDFQIINEDLCCQHLHREVRVGVGVNQRDTAGLHLAQLLLELVGHRLHLIIFSIIMLSDQMLPLVVCLHRLRRGAVPDLPGWDVTAYKSRIMKTTQ